MTGCISMGFDFALFTDEVPPAFADVYRPDDPQCTISLWGSCSELYLQVDDEDCLGEIREEGAPSVAKGIEAIHGGRTAQVCEGNSLADVAADGCDRVQFVFARDPSVCEVEEESVLIPATMALLGSGLVGLAGYATLRWRTRE